MCVYALCVLSSPSIWRVGVRMVFPLIQRILFTTFHFLISAFSFRFLFAFQLDAQHSFWPRKSSILRLFVCLFVSLFAVAGIYLLSCLVIHLTFSVNGYFFYFFVKCQLSPKKGQLMKWW